MPPTTQKDTVIAVLSDMHSGSSVALFPNRFVQFKHGNHTPTRIQQEMYAHFEACAEQAGRMRRDRRLLVVHNGDAVEGLHHYNRQVVSHIRDEQVALHTELMDTFLRTANFKKRAGDRLYYVQGTETHTTDKEDKIVKDLPAEGLYDHLELNVNGRMIWFLHHGPMRGRGPNEGNAMRNWLRDIYWESVKIGVPPPDAIITGHTHTPTYNNYVARRGNDFHIIHGVICPSWQSKTRFAYKVAPVERNEIGAVFVEVSAAGDIRVPKLMLKSTPSQEAVKL